jgi:FkbM family methyltransferase
VQSLLKPWYLYRPSQIFRRVARMVVPHSGSMQEVQLPWGCPIEINVDETIGRAVWTTGIYDLAVVETLWRLADPKLLSLDVGANIGAMTGVLARRSAEVWAFEPHPTLNCRLAANVGRFRDHQGYAPCRVLEIAASDSDGVADLFLPDDFDTNNGTARLEPTNTGSAVTVRTSKLDTLLADREVGVMKLDVEGHEAAVLRGARRALEAERIRNIVFEDHLQGESDARRMLRGYGYSVFSLGWKIFGPTLNDERHPASHSFEAPSFLATRDSQRAIELLQPRGWDSLRCAC